MTPYEKLMQQAKAWGVPTLQRHELEIAHDLCAVVCANHPGCFEFLGDKWHVYEWAGPVNREYEAFGTFQECVAELAEQASQVRPAT